MFREMQNHLEEPKKPVLSDQVIRKHIRVHGKVQGVGFRRRSVQAAEELGITGWVRNEPDGTVLLELQGSRDRIDQLLARVGQARYVIIEKMDVTVIPLADGEGGFQIRRY